MGFFSILNHALMTKGHASYVNIFFNPYSLNTARCKLSTDGAMLIDLE